MKYPLYSHVILAENIPAKGLCRGDVATIVEFYEGRPDQNPAMNWKFSMLWATRWPSSPCASRKSKCPARKSASASAPQPWLRKSQ